MLQFATISILLGMVLGQRFKVLVLAPVLFLTVIAASIAGFAGLEPAWSMVETAGSVIVGVQLGYLLGLGIRQLAVLARARRVRGTSQANTFSRSAIP